MISIRQSPLLAFLRSEGPSSRHPSRRRVRARKAPRPSRTLLVASTGGHLAELHRLRTRLDGLAGEALWVTFDTEQSRSLLAGEEVFFVPMTAPRDYRNVIGNFRSSWRILRRYRVDMIVSTGSGIALSFFPLAWLAGASCHFIETAARRNGPSLTGRLIGALPGVRRYTQCADWAGRRWVYRGSLFDGFSCIEPTEVDGRAPAKVVVTLGTMRQSFAAALNPLVSVLADDPAYDVKWQVGHTPTDGLNIEGHVSVDPQQLQAWMADADLVIAHAGMGSTLDALEAGRRPLLIPRAECRGEHIDDHQGEIAAELAERGLALVTNPGEISSHDVRRALGGRVQQAEASSQDRFHLDTGPAGPLGRLRRFLRTRA